MQHSPWHTPRAQQTPAFITQTYRCPKEHSFLIKCPWFLSWFSGSSPSQTAGAAQGLGDLRLSASHPVLLSSRCPALSGLTPEAAEMQKLEGRCSRNKLSAHFGEEQGGAWGQ